LPDPAKFESPNAFSPNGDGVNDVFQVKMEGPLRKIEFRIYNRYGTLVYFTTKSIAEWDGKINGEPAPAGVYYWMLDAKDSYRNIKVQTNGSITLIR
jgi:gliding motility-associated-like protein